MDQLEDHPTTPDAYEDAYSELVTIKLASCDSTWYFQPLRTRFRRRQKGSGAPGVSTEWRSYYGLRFDDALEGFTVLLTPDGTQQLRSHCHQAGSEVCEHCTHREDARREEISFDAVSRFTGE